MPEKDTQEIWGWWQWTYVSWFSSRVIPKVLLWSTWPGHPIKACKISWNLQDLLIKAVNGQDYTNEIGVVIDFYGADFQPSQLAAQLRVHFNQPETEGSMTFGDVCDYLRSLNQAQQTVYSQVVVLVKLILVMPATNTTSERSFLALRRIKSYLRSTTGQLQLNSLMVLHIHKDRTDKLTM